MRGIFNDQIIVKLDFLVYRFRFLFLYIVFGILSLIIEFIIRNYLFSLGFSNKISTLTGLIMGILFAFWSNSKMNFKIPTPRLFKALLYFVTISFFSASLQFYLSKIWIIGNHNYEINRLFISGIIFLLAYVFHRKYSFVNFKKVGVAIYADKVENIEDIYKKISYYPDFIHIDLVDQTMKKDAEQIEVFRLETIKAYWPDTQIQTHIMSTQPTNWVSKILPFSDVVYVHGESNQDNFEIVKNISRNGKLVGVALMISSDINDYIELLKKADYVLLLTINNPGKSGQNFHSSAFSKIEEINNLPFRNQFVLCVDGGINVSIASHINAECIVSGSSVLKNDYPSHQIMRLQTGSRFEN